MVIEWGKGQLDVRLLSAQVWATRLALHIDFYDYMFCYVK